MFSRLSIAGSVVAFSGLLGALAGCGGASTTPSFADVPRGSLGARALAAQGAAPLVSSGTLLFANDFETDSSAAWTPQLGSAWSVCEPPGESRELCTPGNAQMKDALATAGSSAWTNYEVAAWITPSSASVGGVELVGRYVDVGHFYGLGLRNSHGSQVWSIDKSDGGTVTKLTSGPASYLAGHYYRLRFVLNGSSLTAYTTVTPNDFRLVSEKLLGTGTDTRYIAGSIGVGVVGGIRARFDDIDAYTPGTSSPTPPPANPALIVPSGFYVEAIAMVAGARQLAAADNGDLLVGTTGSSIAIVPNAESDGVASASRTLITLPESPAQGIGLGPSGALYAATNTAVWKVSYVPGTLSAPPATKIAAIRTGPIAPGSDGDVHRGSSLIVSGTTLYVGIGSSCNACVEVDPTRASVQAMRLDGSEMHTFATRIRNPMAFAIDPATRIVFTGGAGQDNLAQGHPYEYLDALNSHGAVADYGWPGCEENQHAYSRGASCANTIVPSIEFPAYSTIIGAAFYPAHSSGTYTFPAAFRAGIFVSLHGSWHLRDGIPIDAPHVAFVSMIGDRPAKPVNWSDPTAQWTDFFTGFQPPNGTRIGRTTGIAVGSRGSLFVADDQSGTIYRIRPGIRP